jgi:hypothetical protein
MKAPSRIRPRRMRRATRCDAVGPPGSTLDIDGGALRMKLLILPAVEASFARCAEPPKRQAFAATIEAVARTTALGQLNLCGPA